MKRLLCILTLLCVLAGLCVLPLSAAEGNVTVRYGAEDLSLTLIDPLDDAGLTFDGSFGFGVATVQNGEMAITVNGQYFDCYAMTTAALPNASFTGAKYLALSIRNESDGDVYFCLQPVVTAGGANMWSGTRAINGRDCFIVPYKFSGYVLIPLGIIADLNVLSVPVVAEDSGIVAYGFHICPDDATTVRFAISDVYVSGALPEYRDPAAETTAATVSQTETTTAEQTTAEQTSAQNATTTVTEPIETSTDDPVTVTTAESDSASNPIAGTDTGCSSMIGLSGLLLLTAVGGAAFVAKKRR